jgi:hypothetical protein
MSVIQQSSGRFFSASRTNECLEIGKVLGVSLDCSLVSAREKCFEQRMMVNRWCRWFRSATWMKWNERLIHYSLYRRRRSPYTCLTSKMHEICAMAL